jgi:hypothetical protein
MKLFTPVTANYRWSLKIILPVTINIH